MLKYLIPALVLFGSTAMAQSDEVIMLSPFTVASSKDNIPPVTIRKTADFLLLQVELINDTRDPEKRREEIYETVRGIISSASQVKALEISTREMTLNLQNYQVRLDAKADKADTSTVELLFKIPLTPTDDVVVLTGQLMRFSHGVKVVGRTEVFPGEIGISVKTPERFRYELIGHIADDVKKVRQLFGESFEILVKGLDQRLQWRRASVSEVELYLPYSYDVLPTKALPLVVQEKG